MPPEGVAGVSTLALDGADSEDRTEPPAAPGPAISLYFVAAAPEGPDAGVRRSVDLRSVIALEGGHRWAFDLERTGGDGSPSDAQIEAGGLDRVPHALEVRLLDRDLGRLIDLRRQGRYAMVVKPRAGGAARFELVVGTPGFVEAARVALTEAPKVTRLLPSFPNPATSLAVVRFDMARAGQARVELFDMAGRRVRTLVNEARDAGRYEETWSLADDQGRPLPAGVYALRLIARDRSDVRKLLKIQ